MYTVNPIPHSIGSKPLSSTSRAIIKQCFEETTPIELLKGHPTVSTEQISNILRIFVDEIAGASLEKLNCVVQRVSRLSLHSLPRRANLKGPEGHSDFETDTNIDSSSDITGTTRQGESTGVQTSDDETRCENKSIISRPADHVQLNSYGCPSPGTITLATMKRETQQGKSRASHQLQATHKSKKQRKTLTKTGRIMNEEYVDAMSWTRTFVSGPVDPKWNPHKIYCQVCKCNVSIKAKGPKEIVRHYSTERNLQRLALEV